MAVGAGNMTDEFAESSVGGPPREICARTFAYALRAIKLYQRLQKRKDGAGWIVGKQYLRAATFIGANVAEVQAGESRADFIHKLGIAQKEARESLFWLRLLAESKIVANSRLRPLTKETGELIAVITAIIVSAKRTKSD
jgi:four helix bundle protein